VVNVDSTILNVALPTLVKQLDATTSQLQWIVDSYSMVLAGMVLVGGSLADRFGRKGFFLFGIGVFAAGSIGSAFSGSVAILIGFRAVMGFGAAFMMPSTLSIINDVFRDPAERSRAIGAWAGTSGLGIAIGPIAGGLLLARFWWGSIFLVNIPFIVLGVIGAVLFVPDSRNPVIGRPDPGGAALSILGFGMLLWAIIEAPSKGWTSASVVVVGTTSVVVLGGFVFWEFRSRHPMLKPGFFRERRFSAAAAGQLFVMFALLGALFVQTQFLQFYLGYSPLQAGVRILPIAGMLAVTASASPFLVRVVGAKVTAFAGLGVVAGGLMQIALSSAGGVTYLHVLPGMMLIGLGAGLSIPTGTNSMVGAVPPGEAGIGSAANGVALQVGGSLGVAVLGSVLSTRYQDRMTSALAGRHVPAAAMHAIVGSLGGAISVAGEVGGATGALLDHVARDAFINGARTSMVAGAVLGAFGALVVLAFLPLRASREQEHDDRNDEVDPRS
jgi:EmrB/QacA subfamily drug resistance transporter